MMSATGFLILLIALVHYFLNVKQHKTIVNPIVLKVSMVISSVLSLVSLITLEFSLNASSILSVVFAVNSLVTCAVFTYFLASKNTPIGNIQVGVGDKLLAFQTPDFDSSSLTGKRILLKFYRGAWCPYCASELIMLEKLQGLFKQYQVEVLAISNDSKAQQLQHKKRDELTHTFICDANLNIIKLYGVEHHKTLGATIDDTINIFGIALPLPWKMRFKAMAIPTTILINETGEITWIDQSNDYRIRASEVAITDALVHSFDKPKLNTLS